MKSITAMKSTTTLLCLLALSTAIGCSAGKNEGWHFTKSWDVRRAVGLKKDEHVPPAIPTRIVSTWEETTLSQPGTKPQRGFGGRLLFFNPESENPIRVEGQLVVYAYDEDGRDTHETHPTRRYVFPADQFVRHESECKLGSSYSVWLPWDEVGGVQKTISLIARFEPKGGHLVAGDQTRHLLPGTQQLASGKSTEPIKQVSDIQLAEFTQASMVTSPEKSDEQTSRRTAPTSIALPRKSWQQRLASPQPNLPKSTATGRVGVLPGPTE